MACGILLITHPQVGKTLLKTAVSLLGNLPVPTETLDVPLNNDTETAYKKAAKLYAKLDDGTGVLVLTDLCGATPDNVARQLGNKHKVRVVTGMNLPMLIKAFNYYSLPLHELARKTRCGGHSSIIDHGEM